MQVKMKTNFRIICALLALCVILSFALYAFGHDHDCRKDGCVICLALRLFKSVLEGVAAVIIAVAAAFSASRAARENKSLRAMKTPVGLFVKLLN